MTSTPPNDNNQDTHTMYTTTLLADDINTEPGCYVESGWGWKSCSHLIEQFSDDTRALRLAYAYDRGWTIANLPEVIADIADQLAQELNDVLLPTNVAHWSDGEFFISPYCDDDPDCSDDTCSCEYE